MLLEPDYEHIPKYVDLWYFIRFYIFYNALHEMSNSYV